YRCFGGSNRRISTFCASAFISCAEQKIGRREVMSRIALSVVVAAVVGVSLTGCSSALSSNSSSEKLQTLKFESDPLGAEVRTPQGQTCKTPCELTVPSHEQPVTITKNNYAANRPSDPGPAAGPLVLGESAADSRTQSGPRRAPEVGAPRRRPQIGSTATDTMR